jgi:signal transduction histidine kinase
MTSTEATSPIETERLLSGQRAVLALLAKGATLREVLSSIARYSELSTPTMLASILWYEPKTGALRRGGHSALPDAFADAVDGLVPGPVAGSCGTAAFRRERVVSFDVKVDPLWSAFRDFAAQHGIRSAWSTPLVSPSDGTLLGVFGMYYPDTREPSPADLQLVDHFTHLATIAIERYRYDEALRESERQRHQVLRALVAGMAHELNTPLGVAKTAATMMADDIAENAPGSVGLAQPLELVRGNVERALGLVRAFRSSILEQDAEAPDTVDVTREIEATLAQLAPILVERRLQVVVSPPADALSVRAVAVRLGEVVTNLVLNAAKHAYGEVGGPLTIAIARSALHDDTISVVVADQGRGMSEEEANRCFEPFFTTDRGSGSAGLGLFLARHVTEVELRGSLLLETKPGTGVRWTLLLPLAKKAGSVATSVS